MRLEMEEWGGPRLAGSCLVLDAGVWLLHEAWERCEPSNVDFNE